MDTISQKLFTNDDMTGSLVSDVVDLRNILHVSYHCVWSGATASGDIYLDVSAESGGPASWENIASVNVSGAGSQLWLDRNAPYVWARIRYVPAAGTGNLTVNVVMKGDK